MFSRLIIYLERDKIQASRIIYSFGKDRDRSLSIDLLFEPRNLVPVRSVHDCVPNCVMS